MSGLPNSFIFVGWQPPKISSLIRCLILLPSVSRPLFGLKPSLWHHSSLMWASSDPSVPLLVLSNLLLHLAFWSRTLQRCFPGLLSCHPDFFRKKLVIYNKSGFLLIATPIAMGRNGEVVFIFRNRASGPIIVPTYKVQVLSGFSVSPYRISPNSSICKAWTQLCSKTNQK